jgi:hypothetical protein
VIHHNLSHQPVDRSTDGSDLLQDLGAVLLPEEGSLDAFDLPPDSVYATQQFGVVVRQLCHQNYLACDGPIQSHPMQASYLIANE